MCTLYLYGAKTRRGGEFKNMKISEISEIKTDSFVFSPGSLNYEKFPERETKASKNYFKMLEERGLVSNKLWEKTFVGFSLLKGCPVGVIKLVCYETAFGGTFDSNDLFESRVPLEGFQGSYPLRRMVSEMNHFLFTKNLCNRIYCFVKAKKGIFENPNDKFFFDDSITRTCIFDREKDNKFWNYMSWGEDFTIGEDNYSVLVMDREKYLKMDLSDYYLERIGIL